MSRLARRCLPTTVAAAFVAAAAWAQASGAKIDAAWLLDSDAVHPGGTIHAAVKFKLDGGFHVQSNKPLDEFLVPTELTLTPPPGISIREIVYPKDVPYEIAGEAAVVFEPEFLIGVALDVAADLKPGEYSITGELHYQACNDKICLQPATLGIDTQIKVAAPNTPIIKSDNPILNAIPFSDAPAQVPSTTAQTPKASTRAADPNCDVLAELKSFDVLGTAAGYLTADEFIAFVDGAEKGTLQRSALEGKGPLAIVLLVILGGILLNLTPCVLPLIPINLAIIGAGAQAGSRARGFALGGAYGLAMAVVYGALGLIVTLTAVSFGTINSTIWFNVAIAILFVVLALAMFDVIAIDFTKYQSKLDASGIGKSGSLALAFGMGAVSALLAGACVAPVVIQVVVYASDQYVRGNTIALALPFFLGLGMALPWPFAGAGLSLLPKPGMWMVRVKQAMGVFILAFAAYYGYLAYDIWRIDKIAAQGTATELVEGGWTGSICQGLAQARAENKPILIDMWATWCKNCFAMDKTTFKDVKVLARLDGYIKIKFQAEKLSESPSREVLERFEGIGLPHYAILRPRTEVATSSDSGR